MRIVCLLIAVAACGGPEKPILSGVPKSEAAGAAFAGGAAAAGLAAAIADPNAATRGKPEQQKETEKSEIPVKEHVNEGVLDRADAQSASHAGSGSATQKPAATPAKHQGPLPKLPTPKEAAEATDGSGGSSP
ncbi:MAG TPA: hypothetical protein VGF94_17555 [Kofleriaceae bacterium]|jgi:hypothetical protein